MRYKLNLFILLVIVLAGSVNAEWDTKQINLGRTGVVTGTNTLSPESYTNYNFTCGTGDGNSDIQPIIMDVTGDGYNELVMYCSGDSNNGAGHIIILDSNLGEIDSITITGEWAVSATYYFQIEVEDIDDDGNYEIIIYHPHYLLDQTRKLELIVYEYDPTIEEFVKEYHYPFINNTNAWNTTHNLTDQLDGFGKDIHIECIGDTCIILHDAYVFSLNMSSKTKNWFHELDDLNSGFNGVHIIDNPNYKLYPVIINIDLSGSDEICFLEDSDFLCLDIDTGSIDYNYSLDISGDGDSSKTFFISSCSASRCETNRMMIIVGSSTSHYSYCDIFDSSDGDKKQTTSTTSSVQPDDGAFCWIEDRDNDEHDELCVIGFNRGFQDQNMALCEELNLGEFDTLRTILDWNLSSGSQDNNLDNQMVIVDYDQDGIYEIIMDSGIWDFNPILDGITYPSSVFLNESVGATNYFSTIVSEYTTNGQLDVLSVPNMDDYDTYYLTIFAESELLNSKITFDGYPIQQISNPICQNELLYWKCSYANGCVADAENDKFYMCVDCFSDGNWACTGRSEYSQEVSHCDLSTTNLTGYVNATFVIWDTEHTQDENESLVVQYYIANENQSCYNTTDPGDIEDPSFNTMPEFLGSPIANAPQPFCLEGGISFLCEEGICYEDADGDSIYLKADCDNDGIYEQITITGDNSVYCYYDTAGLNQLNLQVCDNYHSTCDEISLSVVVSTRSVADVIADGVMDCGSPSLVIIDENGTIVPNLPSEEFRPQIIAPPTTTENIGIKEFCIGSDITFNCEFGYCYWMIDEILGSVLDVDCENDGIIDYTSRSHPQHEFTCTFDDDNIGNATYDNVTELYEYTINMTITNDLGQKDTQTYSMYLSNNSILCEFGDDFGAGCEVDTDCNTGKCSYEFCAYMNRGEYCLLNKQCLSGVCSNNKCTRPDLMTQIDSAKDEQFGDSENTNNFISLLIMTITAGAIIIGGHCLVAVGAGMVVFYSLGIFFALIGWLSGFILLGMFVVALILMALAFVMGLSGD